MTGWCKFTFSSNCRKIQSLEISILFIFSVYNKPKLQNFPQTYTCVKIFYKTSKLHKDTIIHKLSNWTIRQNIQQDYSVTQNFDYNTQTYRPLIGHQYSRIINLTFYLLHYYRYLFTYSYVNSGGSFFYWIIILPFACIIVIKFYSFTVI